MVPLEPWQNSTPFFGMAAFCTTKIDNFRASSKSTSLHLNNRLFDERVDNVFKEVSVKEALKLSIFVVQNADTPKTGVDFHQGSNGLATS